MKNINLFLMMLLLGGLSNMAFGEIVIPPDAPLDVVKKSVPEEDGILSPKKIENLNDNLDKDKDKAPSYVLQQRDSVLIVVPVTNSMGNLYKYEYEHEISNRSTLERNRDRARSYSQNSIKTRTASGVMGKDGVVIFPCTNTMGSLHQDGGNFKSGSVFLINLNGKSVKARCH